MQAILTLLVVAAPPVLSSGAYVDAVRRYATGERDAAVATAREWSSSWIRRELEAVVERAEQCGRGTDPHRASSDCDPATLWPGFSMPAAVMLHTDSVRPGTLRGEAHEDAALRLAQIMSELPALAPFAERWFGMRARLARGRSCDEARSWGERGVAALPHSSSLVLLLGEIEEMCGALEAARRCDEVFSAPDPVRARTSAAATSKPREHFARAERALRAALAVDPKLAEARLRLARVAWWRGELAEARVELQRLLATTPLDPSIAYLAHLFLGRVQQDAGELTEALESFGTAATLCPPCQSARIARSLVRRQNGDQGGARSEIERTLEYGGSTARSDPFWFYFTSEVGAVEKELAALRREVSH